MNVCQTLVRMEGAVIIWKMFIHVPVPLVQEVTTALKV